MQFKILTAVTENDVGRTKSIQYKSVKSINLVAILPVRPVDEDCPSVKLTSLRFWKDISTHSTNVGYDVESIKKGSRHVGDSKHNHFRN